MKALKTYNQYHTDCLIAEGKLKEAERLEERHTGKSAELGPGQLGGQRRSSVKKMERLMEKVSLYFCERQRTTAVLICFSQSKPLPVFKCQILEYCTSGYLSLDVVSSCYSC